MNQSRGDNTSESPSVAPTQFSTDIQERLSARQARRAVKAAERRQRSDALKKEGNDFFYKGDFHEALNRYQKAVDIHASVQPNLLTNLAAAYLKLGMYLEAHEAADNALAADPKSVKARYRRGMARKHLQMWAAADLDFRLVLELAPGNKDAEDALEAVEVLRYEYWNPEDEKAFTYSDYEPPYFEDEPELEDSLSESSDCEHTGNGISCKFYNRTECKRGHACQFSHAPDVKSVRDALGRNVCKYYLIGVCKFDDRCCYLHSKEHLLHKGWWSTTGGVDEERKIYNGMKMLKKAIIDCDNQSKATRSGPKSKRKYTKGTKKQSFRTGVVSVTATSETQPFSSRKAGTKNKKKLPAHSYSSQGGYGSDGSDDYGMLGFTGSEVEELLCQGVKPWDDDAWDVVDALYSY